MGEDMKHCRRHSLYDNEGGGFDIDLGADFCTLWEDQAQKEKIKTSDSSEQEEALKLTEDSWISFHDDSPDGMIDCFDIDEMTSMLESEESCENDQKQEASSFQDARSSSAESCCPSTDESVDIDADRSDENKKLCIKKNKQRVRKKLSSDRKPNRSKSPPRKRHAPDKTAHSSPETPKASASKTCPVPTSITETPGTYGQTDRFDNRYQTLMRNLAVSMRRTEMTRTQVVEIQRGLQRTPNKNNQRSNNSSLSAFFSGSRSTITNGLDQSRRQLQGYMSQMNCNMMF